MLIAIVFILNKKHLFDHLSFLNTGYRQGEINYCVDGYAKTGQYLLRSYSQNDVDSTKGSTLILDPIENLGDDIGIYFFVPLIKNYFNINRTYQAYYLLFSTIVILGYFLAITGICLLYKNQTIRILGGIFIGLTAFFSLFIFDVYVWAFLLTSLIPLYIYAIQKTHDGHKKSFFYLIFFFIFIGVMIGFGNIFRSHSGTGVLIFIFIHLLLQKKQVFKIPFKIILLLVIFSATLLPHQILDSYIKNRNQWLEQHEIKIEKTTISSHVLWHPLFLGLGFIDNNKHGIEWSDQYGYKVANTIKPSLNVTSMQMSSEYEEIVKNKFREIIHKDFAFVLKTYLLKSFYVFLFLLPFLFLTIQYAFKNKLPFNLIFPFVAGISFYLLPAILVWPFPMYFLGAINLLILAQILSMGSYYENLYQTNSELKQQ